jgi:hypothetical protein
MAMRCGASLCNRTAFIADFPGLKGICAGLPVFWHIPALAKTSSID